MYESDSFYIEAFSKLKTDKNISRWDERTTFRAPHKPLLLLAVIDRFAEGAYSTNLIEFDDDLSELFAIYWSLIDPPSVRGNIAMPLYYLQSDGFWHLLPREGYEERLKYGGKIHSISKLRETVYGVRLDDELYKLFQHQESRDTLRTVIVNTYFAPELRQRLIQQGEINLDSYHLALLNQRGMIRPGDSDFLPASDSLAWHMKERFRQR